MESLVEVNCRELRFDVVLNAPIVTQLTLKSKVDYELAFKVKTTVPKRYVVRPNAGVLQPHASLEIEISMESVSAWPADLASCKDKFLLQVAPLGDKGSMASTAFWSAVQATEIVSQKFKVFLSAPTKAAGHGQPDPMPTSSLSATPPTQTQPNITADSGTSPAPLAASAHVSAQSPVSQSAPTQAPPAAPDQAPQATSVVAQQSSLKETGGLRERTPAKVETATRAAPSIIKTGTAPSEAAAKDVSVATEGISPVYSILMFVISLVFIKLFI